MVNNPDYTDILVPREEVVADLSALLEKLDGIDSNDSRSLEAWYDDVVNTIGGCFASTSIELYFSNNCGIEFGYVMGGGRSLYGANVKRAKGILNKIIQETKNTVAQSKDIANPLTPSKEVFIVHGHDDAAREAVARAVSKLGLIPIILHEQPNRGATIIEKFERYADVGFAIILLTPDDEGRAIGKEELSERARQNVVLEMGYFIGKLNREHVMVLRKGDIELPSDVFGVVYELLDDGSAWQFKLGKELQAAGYEVDLNKL